MRNCCIIVTFSLVGLFFLIFLYVDFFNFSIDLVVENMDIHLNIAQLVHVGLSSILSFVAIIMGGLVIVITIYGAVSVFWHMLQFFHRSGGKYGYSFEYRAVGACGTLFYSFVCRDYYGRIGDRDHYLWCCFCFLWHMMSFITVIKVVTYMCVLLSLVSYMFSLYTNFWDCFFIWIVTVLLAVNRYLLKRDIQRSIYILVIFLLSIYVVMVT